jgi:hypothetical protein
MALTKIRYKGLSDERSMSKKELGDAGFPVSGGFHWHAGNLWVQYMDSPSDEFLDMLKRDGNFIVEDAGGENPSVIVKHDPTKADDTGVVVEKDETKAGKAK